MLTKIFIVFVCAAVGTATGYIVMRTYRRELVYLEGACSMIGELRRNIAYRRDSIASALGAFTTESAALRRNIDEYIAYTSAKDGKLELSRGTLSASTYRKATELFRSLGGADGSTQLSELDMYASAFGELKSASEARCKKYGPLAVKLGFLTGALVGVLFL